MKGLSRGFDRGFDRGPGRGLNRTLLRALLAVTLSGLALLPGCIIAPRIDTLGGVSVVGVAPQPAPSADASSLTSGNGGGRPSAQPSGPAVNQPPVVRAIYPAKGPAGKLALTAVASDPEGALLTFEWLALRGQFSATHGDYAIWQPQNPGAYSEAVLVVARDPSGATGRAWLSFKIDRTTGAIDLVSDVKYPPGPSLPYVDAPVVVLGNSLPAVDKVEVSAAGGTTLHLPDADGTAEADYVTKLSLSATCTLADQTTNQFVVWSSSKPESARVDWRGQVTAVAGGQPGPVLVSARAFHDPTRSATISVDVRESGGMRIEVR